MDPAAPLKKFFATLDRDVIPHLSLDCVVFGFDGEALKVLLLRWRNLDRWSLPGGFVRWDESLDAAAQRVLRERTSLTQNLEQFHAFGALDRGGSEVRPAFAAMGVEVPEGHWIAGRIVSIGYLALVRFAEVRLNLGNVVEECGWWDVRARPPMTLDHDAIITRALDTLRIRARSFQLGGALLPEKFTMPELQRLYEAVLGHALDRRNFRKKVLELGIVEQLPEFRTGQRHRAANLYRARPED